MKKTATLIFLLCISLGSTQSHAGFLSGVTRFFSRLPGIGSLVDDIADRKAHNKVNDKINDLYKKALTCSPLESDNDITVKDFIKMKPGFPGWKTLEDLESTAKRAANAADKKSNIDKVKHCFAGCYIRRKLGRSAAVLTAFMKEMKDASDCKAGTHFEMGDYYATIAGSKAGKYHACKEFCGSSQVAKMSGYQMLKAARKFNKDRKEGGKYNFLEYVNAIED